MDQMREEMMKLHEEQMRIPPPPLRGMGHGKKPDFSECDLDGDGKIVEKEFNEARSKRRSERAKLGYPMKHMDNAPSFKEIDKNSDGAISKDEFTAHQRDHFRYRMQNRQGNR
jgi:hypothetical protein